MLRFVGCARQSRCFPSISARHFTPQLLRKKPGHLQRHWLSHGFDEPALQIAMDGAWLEMARDSGQGSGVISFMIFPQVEVERHGGWIVATPCPKKGEGSLAWVLWAAELKQFGQQTKALESGFCVDFHDVFNTLCGTPFFTTATVWFLSFRGLE